MKKYLYSALALPLLFACSSENFDEKVVSNDQFAGIEKVDAEFSMDGFTRMDKGSWNPEEGDLWGFAWMGDGTVIANNPADGKAYQNHNLIQTSGIFTPQTSIYVGKYYIYRPYDETTVTPQAINFKSLEEQTLNEGMASTTDAWKNLAKTAINIGDKWTDVTPGGRTYGDTKVYDEPGIKKSYKIFAAMFSNQTGLDLTYVKNNVAFDGKKIKGATDIDYTYPSGSTIGAADIYDGTIELAGQAKSFTYAPTKEPNAGVYPQVVNGKTVYHNGEFWADKSGLPTAGQDGFVFTPGAITLKAPTTAGISTDTEDNKAWFWINSLPKTAGDAINTTNVTTIFNTSYGVVTVTKQLKDCAYAFEQPDGAAASAPKEWIKFAAATDQTKTPKEWDPATHNTFVNQYGNHKGKYALTVDFSTGVMNNMHIKNDAHLQKALKYYIASGKTESPVVLYLDQAGTGANNVFKISKISIALLQTINATANKVLVEACATHGTPKIIVTQDGQDAIGLAAKKEVPALNKVFNAPTDVFLSKDCEWTWTGGDDFKTALTVDANVASITNEGTLTVNATNIQLTTAAPLANAAGATMNITKVTTVKNALTNLGTINVGAADNTAAELRAYGAEVMNNATGLDEGEYGVINNYGVVGKSAGTAGEVNNYGYIKMHNNGAITLLHSNEKGVAKPFSTAFKEDADPANWNKMGIVELPEGNPYALVSVSNGDETGFIKYKWTAETYTHDAGNVKYNTLVVERPDNGKIVFAGACDEIKYIEFNGIRTQVVNPTLSDKLGELKGIYVHAGKSIIIEKTNQLVCSDAAYLAPGATVYLGGVFNYQNDITNYFGDWTKDQIVEF